MTRYLARLGFDIAWMTAAAWLAVQFLHFAWEVRS